MQARQRGCFILIATLVIQALPSGRPTGRTLDVPSRVRLVLRPDRRNGAALEPGALDSAVRVLQRRLDEFGVRDAMVREGPDDRLVVEASGVKELGRLEALLLHIGGLEFRITDMKNRFRDALPGIDKTLRRAGVRAPPRQEIASSVAQLFQGDTGKAQGERGRPAETKTTDLNAPGPVSSML